MQMQLITQLEDLEAIADEWRELEPPTPFQSPDWLIPWWQVYGDANRELAVLAVRDERGELVGLCPWYLESLAAGHRLRWLGDGAVCSDHATLLIAKHASRTVIESVVAWLDEVELPDGTHLEFEAVNVDDGRCQQLLDGIEKQGWLITAPEDTGSCSISLPASWDEYLKTVSKNQRKRCRRWQREFFDTGRAQVEVVTDPAECRAAFEQLVVLHNERRQATGTCGAFEDDRFRRFHESAIDRLAQRGQVQLRLLSVDGQLAAVEYVLTDEKAFYAYQSGLSDEGAALSAGSLSVLSLLWEAVASGRRQVDLLRGVEPYKFSWGATHRPARTVVARRRTWSGVLHTCFDRARHQVRSMREPRRNMVPAAREVVSA
jgi:CelD/BcsL family acetyltransferase involved in cellulose biosynthesis